MSDTRYPTRMHEVLGVEAFEQFQIKGVSGHFFLTAAGQICSNEAGMDNNYLIDAINKGIIHLPPPLTDEQIEQLKAIWTLGGRWLARDCDGAVNYYTKIPYKESGYWFYNDDAERYGYAIPLSACVCELQELNKADEPLDIAAALGVGE